MFVEWILCTLLNVNGPFDVNRSQYQPKHNVCVCASVVCVCVCV